VWGDSVWSDSVWGDRVFCNGAANHGLILGAPYYKQLSVVH